MGYMHAAGAEFKVKPPAVKAVVARKDRRVSCMGFDDNQLPPAWKGKGAISNPSACPVESGGDSLLCLDDGWLKGRRSIGRTLVGEATLAKPRVNTARH